MTGKTTLRILSLILDRDVSRAVDQATEWVKQQAEEHRKTMSDSEAE